MRILAPRLHSSGLPTFVRCLTKGLRAARAPCLQTDGLSRACLRPRTCRESNPDFQLTNQIAVNGLSRAETLHRKPPGAAKLRPKPLSMTCLPPQTCRKSSRALPTDELLSGGKSSPGPAKWLSRAYLVPQTGIESSRSSQLANHMPFTHVSSATSWQPS